MNKKTKKKIFMGILGFGDVMAIICLVIFYSPFFGFKDWLVTTAMSTMKHKYIARTFYTDKMINEVMSRNYIEDFKENTDTSKININQIEEQETYESVYEQEILEHKKGEDYKIIEFDGNNYHVKIAVIYDPSRVSLYTIPAFGNYGNTITEIAEESGAKVAMNASGFMDASGKGHGGTPTGTVIKNGEVVYRGYPTGWPGGFIGFNKDHILVLTKDSAEDAIAKGMVDAVEFGPFLVVNGEPAEIAGNGGSGTQPRTAIAQRQDGVVLFIVVDGHGHGGMNFSARGGVTYSELIDILMRYKAYNAANLDGGASTSLAIEGSLYNKPCGVGGTGERNLPTAWIFK
ncbi:MAG: phosphodiester glycosidase family protein [Bacilli bacterium]|nr:phosphodiester glycosidase family protein [Bacilli bacterium]